MSEETALVESVNQEEYTDSVSLETEPVRFTVSLPGLDDREALQNFLAFLEKNKEHRGVITLAKWIEKYLYHQHLSDGMWERAVATSSFVNGVRLHSQKVGDKKRSLRSDAEDFYESLGTPALRLHCKLFEIDFDSYNSIEEVVAELVQKHVDMVEAV